MAAILTICFRILPNFEVKLEIPNIMLVCVGLKSIGQQIKISERLQHISDGRPAFPYPPLRFAWVGDNKDKNKQTKTKSI
jgi:hypothetical protein